MTTRLWLELEKTKEKHYSMSRLQLYKLVLEKVVIEREILCKRGFISLACLGFILAQTVCL